jgi:acetyl-CoA carboxylase/biotin carboxylase 1
MRSKSNVHDEMIVEENPLATYVQQRGGKRVIRRILLANNGMAATKCIMSMRKWAFTEFGSEKVLTFIAMATDEDLAANAEFIRLADSFVQVPGGKNVNNYKNVKLICKLAQEQKVDAVWPGWGHASEDPELPTTLKEMGITFIGPNATVMAALGDKIAANILAQTAKVASIPWSGDGLTAELSPEGTIPQDIFNKAMVTSADDCVQRAKTIGYPIMVKASEGGGGKGIRKVTSDDEMRTAFTNVSAEVPGSPIFLMQMCSGARHLEVQILGDLYGNTVALNGRDCSTQRRFQKIFEEGPPVIANPVVFKEMERAAMRLTALVGYSGAGTVEYLYNAIDHQYYFLELNPRLQVEHPVTEGITGCNLPATQLQIAMGIPLYSIPDIRRFYGLDPVDTDKIDFFAVDYPPITTHVMASRITAENPEEGFKPTSGKIESVKFQSFGDCWGYFSVGNKGGIHEFADSQFGHIFAKASNGSREDARKMLQYALKNMTITGDIRHPIDYLVELLDAKEFKENTITTMWLDGVIANKLIGGGMEIFDAVFFAAVYRAHSLVKKRTQDIVASIQKGQLVLLGKTDTNALVSFPLEIVYGGQKFNFQICRSRQDTYVFKVGEAMIEAKVIEQPDGSLFVKTGNSVKTIKGSEESLGLRLMVGPKTIMLPTIYDPSELRSDVNGKVVRYLHDDGAMVAKGEAYIELEAMKMIMPLKSTEEGKISHSRAVGSVVAAGELLASLVLKDPSKVPKVVPFAGEFMLDQGKGSEKGKEAAPTAEPNSIQSDLSAKLNGYEVPGKGALLVEKMFEEFKDSKASGVAVEKLLEEYLQVERPFVESIKSKQPYDELLRAQAVSNKDKPGDFLNLMTAHNKLAQRHEVVLAMLREIFAAEGSGMSCMYVPDIKADKDMHRGVFTRIEELAAMPTVSGGSAGDYGSVRYLAQQLLNVVPEESFDDRVNALRTDVSKASDTPKGDLSIGSDEDGGLHIDLMVNLLSDSSAPIQQKAQNLYLQWLASPARVTAVKQATGDIPVTVWTQQLPIKPAGSRKGMLAVIPSIESLAQTVSYKALQNIIDAGAGQVVVDAGGDSVPLNLLHIVVGQDAFPGLGDRTLYFNSDSKMNEIIAKCKQTFNSARDVLGAASVGEICVVLPQPPRHPRFVMFTMSQEMDEWTDNSLGRDLWPTWVNLLELNRLKRSYTLSRIHKEVRPTSHIYLATRPAVGAAKAPHPELLMRSLHYSKITSFPDQVDFWLRDAMQEIEHALLDPQVSKFGSSVTSRIFLHVMGETKVSKDVVIKEFERAMNRHMSSCGGDMLNMAVDEIELKMRLIEDDADDITTLRLSSSSLDGGFMKIKALVETADPLTGLATRWQKIGAPDLEEATKIQQNQKIQEKRVGARRAGSTYVYDLPGLLKVALNTTWSEEGTKQLMKSPSGEKISGGRQSSVAGMRPSSPRGAGTDRNRLSSLDTEFKRQVSAISDTLFEASELVMDWDKMELSLTARPDGSNDVGMVAWRCTMKTPEYPEGRDIVLIANDITYQAGSFGVREDQVFEKASAYARKFGIPRIYVACNSGARVGLVEELKTLYKVKWIDEADPSKGFDYLYLTKADYDKLEPRTVEAHEVQEAGEVRYVIDAIIGDQQKSTKGGIGVENLKGSGLIAGETSRAYQETFTLSYVTGRSVGIGAYLNRLGQRVIQRVSSPMILTGYSALNKLLGKNVYSSQDQLGGPQIMVPNGVTHQVVSEDNQGMLAIINWLSFVPKDAFSIVPLKSVCTDTWDRDVEFVPPKQPYDPRDFLQGVDTPQGSLKGFFDTGSFVESLSGWGRTVVVGRARLGGIPMGVIAVETRSVERFIPADPGNADSSEVVEPQAGQVWFPDSAFKTAQALRDFNNAENLPVMIFANWRGFSGGTRDMYGEILKYGAQIVDALVDYKHPIFIYLPPNGELRGGAWVVIDPSINPEKMEMYADVDSRGGILEPPGIVEVKYRAPQQIEAMHRLDPQILALTKKISSASAEDKTGLEKEIKAREKQLLPLYTSIAVGFADLHDKTGRMKAKGVITDAIEWKKSRRYFYWRVKRRVLQDDLIKNLRAADSRMGHGDALKLVKTWAEAAQVKFDSDQSVCSWLEGLETSKKVAECREKFLKSQVASMLKELPQAEEGAKVVIQMDTSVEEAAAAKSKDAIDAAEKKAAAAQAALASARADAVAANKRADEIEKKLQEMLSMLSSSRPK